MNEIVKLDPQEYGLDSEKVSTIEQAFAPKIAERDGYIQLYEEILKKEITHEVELQAKDLRNKLVKVRTGIADIHKTQKAFFLAAGRFVDAWKNKETEPVTQMEENLMSIEKYSENLEKERIAKIEEQRKAEVLKYSEVIPESLGLMMDSVFDAYVTGLKIAYDAKIKAEKEAELARIESERVEKLNIDRKFKTSRLIDYIDNYDSINFGVMVDDDFDILVKNAIDARAKKEAEIEAQRVENERLKKEAEEKEKAAQIERDRIVKELLNKKEARRLAAIQFLFDNDFKNAHGGMEAKNYSHFIGANHYSDFDTDNEFELFKKSVVDYKEKKELEIKAEADRKASEEKARIEREENERKLAVERAEREKIEAELKAKAEAERKAKDAEELAAKKAAAAPDKEKLKSMIDLCSLVTVSLSSDESKAVLSDITAKHAAFKKWAFEQIEKL